MNFKIDLNNFKLKLLCWQKFKQLSKKVLVLKGQTIFIENVLLQKKSSNVSNNLKDNLRSSLKMSNLKRINCRVESKYFNHFIDEKRLTHFDILEEMEELIDSSDVIVDTADFIPQLDGMGEISDSSDKIEYVEPSKTVFGINCEHREVVQLMNFFRSFNVLWLSSQDHNLCWLDEDCFFCNLRSMFLRLRQERIKGPFLLKLNEFVCNMKKYEDILDYTLLDNLLEIEQNIENTLQLIFRFRKASPFFSTTLIDCEECSSNLDKFVLDIVF